jgi:hypothetical protein
MNDATNHDTGDDQVGSWASGRLVREALRASIEREIEDAEGRRVRKLDLVVNAIVEKALAGDVVAAREIFDRIAGKPAPGVRPPPEPRRYIVSWKGDEP